MFWGHFWGGSGGMNRLGSLHFLKCCLTTSGGAYGIVWTSEATKPECHFYVRTSFTFLFWDLASLEPPFGVKLDRWSLSGALQCMAEPKHCGARTLTGHLGLSPSASRGSCSLHQECSSKHRLARVVPHRELSR